MSLDVKIRDVVRLQPGDYVAVILEDDATAEDYVQMQEALNELWPDVKVAIMAGVADVAVFRPDGLM